MFEETRDYVKQRKAFGKTVADLQVSFSLVLRSLIFPGSSATKESACNAGDHGSIPGLGRSAGEGMGYPLQSSWASLVAQLVKNPPAIWQTWV